MYKDFVNVTPESGGAGTTPIAVAADENEGAARSTSLNIAGGGVTRTVSITQKKMLVENQIEVKYWLDAATSGTGKSIYLEAYANNDVASNLKINFSIDQQGPTGEWETNTPVEILINTGDNASTTYEIPYYDYGWRFHEEVATITPSQDEDFIYDFAGFIEEFRAPEIGIWKINTLAGEPNGGEATNPSAVYQVSSNADFKKVLTFASLGGVTIPCVTMVNEVIGMTIQGTQLLINTYFGDLSDVEIPQKYYFEMCGKQGYFLTVINHLYGSSKAKTKRGFKKLLAETLPSLIDPKNGLIQKEPELSPADFKRFDKFLLRARKL